MLKIDNKADIFHYRTLLFILVISIFTLLSRYFYLQVVEHERYFSKSQVNSVKAQATYAPRGLILDRNGEVLVENYPTYILTVTPYQLENKDKQFNYKNGLKEGDAKWYFSGGKLSAHYVYINGNLEGKQTSYRKDGSIKLVANYAANTINGEWIAYHKNGQVEQKGLFKVGKKSGKWITYNEQGKVIKKENF